MPRTFWLKITLIAGMISGQLLTVHLWMGTRFYPLTPVFTNLPTLDLSSEKILYCLLVGLLVGIAFSSRPKILIILTALIFLVYVLFDQSRLQPWIYQYVFMLGTFAVFDSDIEKEKSILTLCRFIVVSIYIYSGLQKFNVMFFAYTYPWVVEPLTNSIPYLKPFMLSLALFAPFIEIGIGVGLLTKKYRKISILLGILMHVGILLLLGPLGRKFIMVIIPWNITMVLFLIILFWKENLNGKDSILPKKSWYKYVVVILFGCMPFLSFFGLWDEYLSSSLYSGNIQYGFIKTNELEKQGFPSKLANYFKNDDEGIQKLSILDWSMDELHVSPYPEERIFKHIGEQVCSVAHHPEKLTLEIYERPNTFTGIFGIHNYACSELK